MKTYELEFDVDALKEWRKLDKSIQAQFKKQLTKRLLAPCVPSARLRGDLQNTYKIKLRDAGYPKKVELVCQMDRPCRDTWVVLIRCMMADNRSL